MEHRQVFISHSADDADWARGLAEALKQRGISVWCDSDAQPGESFGDDLEAGLRSSDALVALLDSKSTSRPNVFFEVGAALGLGKRVVLIVPKDLDPDRLPFKFRSRRYLIRDTPEKTAEELSSNLEAA